MFVGFQGNNGLSRDIEFGGKISLSQARIGTDFTELLFHDAFRIKALMKPKHIQKKT